MFYTRSIFFLLANIKTKLTPASTFADRTDGGSADVAKAMEERMEVYLVCIVTLLTYLLVVVVVVVVIVEDSLT